MVHTSEIPQILHAILTQYFGMPIFYNVHPHHLSWKMYTGIYTNNIIINTTYFNALTNLVYCNGSMLKLLHFSCFLRLCSFLISFILVHIVSEWIPGPTFFNEFTVLLCLIYTSLWALSHNSPNLFMFCPSLVLFIVRKIYTGANSININNQIHTLQWMCKSCEPY